MKKILSILGLLILSLPLMALELPLNPTTKLVVKQGAFSTIKLPFSISRIEKSPFVSKAANIPAGVDSDTVINSEVLANADRLPQPKRAKKGASRKPTPLKMKWSGKTISLYPNKVGSTSVAIYGYDKYPVILKIIVRKSASADHFFFKDYETQSKEIAGGFEMVEHEKVLSMLWKYGFNNMTPPGYNAVNVKRVYHKKGLKFTLVKQLVGEQYREDVYIVKNTTKGNLHLYEEMFYVDGIYGIAFENNDLKRGEATRMFVIKTAGK